jgi:hypothetical protein
MKNNNNNDNNKLDKLPDSTRQLRERIQDLEIYIAGRKAHWDALAERLSRQRRDAIDLETASRVRDARIDGFAKTAARLERRVEGQRREIEILRERLTEVRRTGAHEPAPSPSPDEAKVILRAAYDKLASMRAEQSRLKAMLADKDAYIDRLCGRLSELELERGETTKTLRKQRDVIEYIETEIRTRLTEVARGSQSAERRREIASKVSELDQRRALRREREDGDFISPIGRLTLLTDGGETTVYDIGAATVTIGRGPQNAIQLSGDSVSREHARLTPTGSGLLIEDLCSRNGLKVNNRCVNSHLLRSGDELTIGKLRLRFTELVIPIDRHNAF